MMLPLKSAVEVTRPGSTKGKPGVIVGRTREQTPHYDVLIDGAVLNNLPAAQVKVRE